jgi:4-hydroxybenzoate polyprenyltransferase
MIDSVVNRLVIWGDLVRFSHSIFAIPFAGVMLLVVMQSYPVSLSQLGLLVLCVVSARTAAMAFNRLVDARVDGLNERTQNREIPSGRVSNREALGLVIGAALAFIGASFGLGTHCGFLSFPVLGVLCGYSFFKRFSMACHLVLGVSLALAPGGVWYALTANWSWKPVPLLISVAFWVAGFDILYACQDAKFDREQGLFSVPSVFGVRVARGISVGMHILSVFFLFMFGRTFDFGFCAWGGVFLFSVLIASQHLVVQQRGIESIDQLFFVRNGLASVALFTFVLLDFVIGYQFIE